MRRTVSENRNFAPGWELRFSENLVSLAIDKSVLMMPGPRTWPIPELPNVYGAGAAKQPVSNHSATVFGVETWPHVMFATLPPPLLLSWLFETPINRGCPAWNIVIPLIDQPLRPGIRRE